MRLELRRHLCRVVLEEDVVVARSGTRVVGRGDKVDEARRGACEEREDGVRALGEGLRAARAGGEGSARRTRARERRREEGRATHVRLGLVALAHDDDKLLVSEDAALCVHGGERLEAVLGLGERAQLRPEAIRAEVVQEAGREEERAPVEEGSLRASKVR